MAAVTVEATLEGLSSAGLLKETFPLDLKKCISLSDFLSLSETEKVSLGNVAVVLDNAKWASTDLPVKENGEFPEGASFASGDGIAVGRHVRGTKFIVYSLDPSANGLAAERYLQLFTNNPEEEERMSMNLEDLRQGIQGAAAATPPVGEMQSFNQGQQSGEDNAAPTFVTNIREKLANQSVRHLEKLHTFNYFYGRMVGYITANDEKVEFKVVKEYVTQQGKKVLKDNAPAEVQSRLDAGQPIDPNNYQSYFKVKAVHTAPGKILAALIDIPVGGFVPFEELGDPNLEIDRDKTDLKTLLLGQDLYPTVLTNYFRNLIKEDERTHGQHAGDLTQRVTHANKKKDGVATSTVVVRRQLKPAGRSSVIIPSNYLPLRTYEKVDVTSGNLSQEQVDVLNQSAFRSVVSAKTRDEELKYNDFDAATRQAIRPIGERIESNFITLDASSRQPIVVSPYYDKKGEPLQTIELPVRELIRSEGKKDRFPLIVYDVTSKKYEEDGYREKTSLHNGRFSQFLQVAGEVVNAEALRELKRRQGGGGGGASESRLSTDDMIKMQLALSQNALEDVQLAEVKDTTALMSKLFRTQMQATARA